MQYTIKNLVFNKFNDFLLTNGYESGFILIDS